MSVEIATVPNARNRLWSHLTSSSRHTNSSAITVNTRIGNDVIGPGGLFNVAYSCRMLLPTSGMIRAAMGAHVQLTIARNPPRTAPDRTAPLVQRSGRSVEPKKNATTRQIEPATAWQAQGPYLGVRAQAIATATLPTVTTNTSETRRVPVRWVFIRW